MGGAVIEPRSLEDVFGDPSDNSAVLSQRAVQASDDRQGFDPQVESLLTAWGFGAEFVPCRYGGRWGSTEDLVRRLLPVFRRDPALGLGQGVTSLMAAANVWVADEGPLHQELANRLLNGERVAVGFHEFDHGNDLLRNESKAELAHNKSDWLISGRKDIINNVNRAESVLLFARTDINPGPKSFSLLLWRKDRSLGGHALTTERIHTAGVRGCQIGVAEFDRLSLPADSLVGQVGSGVSIALRAFQVTRSVIPALATGTVDSALRLAVVYLRQRQLYGNTAWDIPHARASVTRVWGALIAADALSRASVRALHLHPDECFIASAATKYLVPTLLNDAMNELSVLFGSTFYARSDEFGVFEKWVRDLIVLPIGHAGSMACLSSIVPHLPTWSRRSRGQSVYDPALFRTDTITGDLDFSRLGLGAGKADSMTAPLESGEVISAVLTEQPALSDLISRWQGELKAVREVARLLDVAEIGIDASPTALETARRLCRLMAVGALLGTWYEGRTISTSPFRRSSSAALAAFYRISDFLPADPGGSSRVGMDVWSGTYIDSAAEDIAKAVDEAFALGVEEMHFPWGTGGQDQ